jgi:hypothetical protein
MNEDVRSCAHCSKKFLADRRWQRFCSAKCRFSNASARSRIRAADADVKPKLTTVNLIAIVQDAAQRSGVGPLKMSYWLTLPTKGTEPTPFDATSPISSAVRSSFARWDPSAARLP